MPGERGGARVERDPDGAAQPIVDALGHREEIRCPVDHHHADVYASVASVSDERSEELRHPAAASG
jgi:hypothetical protein